MIEMVELLYCEDNGRPNGADSEKTIERIFSDAKEKHAISYTWYRDLAQITNWVKLKFDAMNPKKRPVGCGRRTLLRLPSSFFGLYTSETRLILDAYAGLLDRLGPQTNLVCGLSLFYGIKEEKDVTAGQ